FSAYVSPQIEGMLGYTPEEWLETPNLFWRVLHPDDVDRVRTEHRQGYESGGSFATQYRLVARGGRNVWVEDQVQVVHDAEGAPVRSKEVEDAVAESRPYTIEYRVIDRNAEIHYVVERGQAILGADGDRMLDGAIFDLTARRLAEDERMKLAAIVESTDDAI